MRVTAEIKINSTKEKVWQVISDIENSVNVISGIIKIEILNPSGDNLVGLKWKETRLMYGKEADETMWVTHAEQNCYYQTRAESHGAIYRTRLKITEEDEGVTLRMSFDGQAVSLMAKIMNIIFGGVMKKSMVKALNEDLEDIKKAVEAL